MGVKVNDGSNHTPNILGVLSTGRVEFLSWTWGWAGNRLFHGVNKVMEDFSGVIRRRLFSARSTIGGNDSLRRSESWEEPKVLSGSVSAIVTSSACDATICAGEGQSAEKILNRVGERTAPCGTPLLIVWVSESEPWYFDWADRPLR